MEALADSGASTLIISWDLAKKVNMIVLEEVIQSKQIRKELKEEPPDSQGRESIQAITSGADQWRKSSRAGRN